MKILVLLKWSHRPSHPCSLSNLEWCLYFKHIGQSHHGMCLSFCPFLVVDKIALLVLCV